MKRSEAIRLIMAYCNLNTFKTLDDFSGDYLMTINECSNLVNFLTEVVGMLPPEIDKMIEGHQCTINEWEPE